MRNETSTLSAQPTHPEMDAERVFFVAARRNEALTAPLERLVLQWLAVRTPLWVSPDAFTLLGLFAQVAAGAAYALARSHRSALLLAMACVGLNWLGDSMDGTLARVRAQPRPRYGFYVDHVVDVLGAAALVLGMGLSGLVHGFVAAGMLVAFLLLSAESYLATYTLGRFEMSQGPFGPTEIRLLLMLGTATVWHSPFCKVFERRFLLLDLGGSIATVCMLGVVLYVTARHTAQLYREETLAR